MILLQHDDERELAISEQHSNQLDAIKHAELIVNDKGWFNKARIVAIRHVVTVQPKIESVKIEQI